MPSEALHTVSIGLMNRGSMLRRMPRPLLIGGGLLMGGAVAALAHLAGADMRALTGSHPGLLTGLLPAASEEELLEAGAHVAAPPSQP